MLINHLLNSTISFAIGLLIFYLLTIIVVHLGGFLQQKISNYQWSREEPLQGYPKVCIVDIFSSWQLHKLTLKYLNPFIKTSFPSIGIRKIDRLLLFFNSLRIFFLPFIVCGSVFLFFSFEIKGYLPFDLENTFYSTLQKNLLALKNYPFLLWIRENKIWLNLVLGVLIIVIPFLFINRRKLNIGLKRFNQALIYIAIFTNVSFFSGLAASSHKDVDQKLENVSLNIEEIHDRIYRKASSLIVYDYVQDVEEIYREYEELLQKLEEPITAHRVGLSDETLGRELDEHLRKLIDSVRIEVVSYYPLKVRNTLLEKDNLAFEIIRENNQSQTFDYFFQDNEWTYKDGTNLEAELNQHIENVKETIKKNCFSSKSYLIIEEVYSALSACGISNVTELLSEKSNQLTKALLKSVSKATKADVVDRIDKALKKIYPKIQKSLGMDDKKNRTKVVNRYNSIVNLFHKKHDNLRSQINEIEQRYKRIIEQELHDRIHSHNDKLVYEDFKFFNDEGDEVKITEERKRVIFNKRLNFLQGFSFESNDKDGIFQNIVNGFFDDIVDYNFKEYGQEYLDHLSESQLSKTTIKKRVGNIFNKMHKGVHPKICFKCGLDMNVVPFCPASIIGLK